MALPKDEILISFATVIDKTIKYLFNSNKKDFESAFGKDEALYMWDKFTIQYNRDEGAFFCYLDGGNKLKLMRDVFRKYGTEKQ